MRRGAVVAVVGGALALAGCSAGQGASPGNTVTTSPSPSSPSTGDVPSEAAVPECSADVAEGIDRTVSAQLEAFATGDFRAALALASKSFRGAIDVKGFREVILTGYPEVASSIDHRLVECRQPGPSSAAALVDVTGDNGVTARLAYRFVLEQGGWRIDGASTLGTAALPTA
jgi:Domain of unknown function (DUF4864)